MKRLSFLLLIFAFVFFSCATKQEVQPSSPQEDSDEFVEVIEDENSDEIEFLEEEESSDDEEYLRSTNNLSAEETVTKEEFEDDKAQILKMIAELEVIMKKGDFESWKKYIAPDSLTYYSTAANIRKVQKKLPDKTIQLHGLSDYFKHVFIKARQGSTVEEIRYISKNNIRGGYYKNDGTFVITYYFVKIDGKWYVHIPPV